MRRQVTEANATQKQHSEISKPVSRADAVVVELPVRHILPLKV